MMKLSVTSVSRYPAVCHGRAMELWRHIGHGSSVTLPLPISAEGRRALAAAGMQQPGGEWRHGRMQGERQPLGLKSAFITYKDYLVLLLDGRMKNISRLVCYKFFNVPSPPLANLFVEKR
jgi:hypothetical protein